MNAVPESFDLAIVGGGAAGTLAALHALRNARPGQRIVIIEAGAALGEGIAYATRQKEHLLNVPAHGMSAFADAPEDFLDYAHKHDTDGATREQLAGAFVPRRRYADYLRTRLQQAQRASAARLLCVHARATALDETDNGFRIGLASGTVLHARGIVLASGNSPRPLPVKGADALQPAQRAEAWNYAALQRIAPDADVAIIGTGLSMLDAVQTLAAQHHRGRVHVLSRHALLPLPHMQHPQAHDFDVAALHALPLRMQMRALRRHVRDAQAAGLPWQSVFEQLRPHGQALWQALSDTGQRRFLRHAVRHWDTHRHRVAPQLVRLLQELRASGQLQLHRARALHIDMLASRVQLCFDDTTSAQRALQVDVVVNATGMQLDATRMPDPLLAQLLQRGKARPGPHALGLDTADDGALLDADGKADARIRVVGSLRIGNLWESLAAPELRAQAEAAARALLA